MSVRKSLFIAMMALAAAFTPTQAQN